MFIPIRLVPQNKIDTDTRMLLAFDALMLSRILGRRRSTPKGISDYLVLLSIEQTCKYRGISFLNFLRSGELDIEEFEAGRKLPS